jgi:hypothetical protein
MPDINDSLVYIKANDLIGIAKEIFEQGGCTWITVTGNSMYPFLRGGRDSVELSKTDFASIKKGDIVLIRRVTGEYVLHRVLKKEPDCFYMIGDAQQWIEGPLTPAQLQAVVIQIKRKGHIIRCDNLLLRFFVFLWRLLIPVRTRIFKIKSRIGRLVKHNTKQKAK